MEWKHVESTVKPEEFDTVSSKKWNYIRKNITSEKTDDILMYKYDQAKVLKEDWDIFLEVSDNISRVADLEDAVIELAELIG